MKAVVYHGMHDMRVDNVPDPVIEHPDNLIIKVTSTAICGSDLHIYDGFMSPFMEHGDIVGHEPMGVFLHDQKKNREDLDEHSHR